MTGKIYDRTAFIEAYLASLQSHFPINERERFLEARFRSLEKAFGVQISQQGVPAHCFPTLFTLFQGAVKAYLGLPSNQDNVVDNSLWNIQFKQIGAAPQSRKLLTSASAEGYDESKQALFEMIERTFITIWGPLDRIVRSEDLLRYGFDDSLEPEQPDY